MTEYHHELLPIKSAQEEICVFPLDVVLKKKPLSKKFVAYS